MGHALITDRLLLSGTLFRAVSFSELAYGFNEAISNFPKEKNP